MEYTNLGNSGLKISKVILGCMSYGDKRWMPWVLEEDDALTSGGARPGPDAGPERPAGGSHSA